MVSFTSTIQKYVLSFLIVLVSSTCYGQQLTSIEKGWWDGYKGQTWTASDVNALIDQIGYHPYMKKGTDIKMLKTVFLQLSHQDYRQLNDESAYLCAVKHDDYFEIWNMYHPKVDKTFWNRNCKGLIILLRIDGIAKSE